MTVEELRNEYSNLSEDRRKDALKALFELLLADLDGHSDVIDGLLDAALDHEADDGFGTEGARL